jgi:hypothetical protein
MKKMIITIFLLFATIAFSAQVQKSVHFEITKTNLFCSYDETNITFVPKNTILATQLIQQNCFEKKEAAENLKNKIKETKEHSQLIAKIIHSIVLLTVIAFAWYIIKRKRKDLYMTVPFLASFIIIEITFVFFNINLIEMLLK